MTVIEAALLIKCEDCHFNECAAWHHSIDQSTKKKSISAAVHTPPPYEWPVMARTWHSAKCCATTTLFNDAGSVIKEADLQGDDVMMDDGSGGSSGEDGGVKTHAWQEHEQVAVIECCEECWGDEEREEEVEEVEGVTKRFHWTSQRGEKRNEGLARTGWLMKL